MTSVSIFLLTLFLTFPHPSCFAQRIGEQAEMNRLEQQADDLASQDDPEGAALAIGKAAMMAELLATDSRETNNEALHQAAGLLYRAQELGFRALALFKQTGGTPPAPAGVCQFLVQGQTKLHHSMKHLATNSAMPKESLQMTATHLIKKNEEWEYLLHALSEDFALPCYLRPINMMSLKF